MNTFACSFVGSVEAVVSPPKNKCLSNTHSHACSSRYILHKHTDMPTVIKIYRQNSSVLRNLCLCACVCVRELQHSKHPQNNSNNHRTNRPTYKMPIITNINLSEANNTTASQRSLRSFVRWAKYTITPILSLTHTHVHTVGIYAMAYYTTLPLYIIGEYWNENQGGFFRFKRVII